MGDKKAESHMYDDLIENCEDLLKQNATNYQSYLELEELLRLQFAGMNHDYKRLRNWMESAHEDFLVMKHSDFTRLYEVLVKHNLVKEFVHFGKKKEMLQLQFIEIMNECVNLKDDLNTANKSVISLKREYSDLTGLNDAVLENILAKESFNLARSLEILRMNFIEIIENSENSQVILETACIGLAKLKLELDLLKQHYEALSGNEMVKGFIDYAKFQENLQIEIAKQVKDQKETLDRLNQNLASLKSQLAETNEMLKTQQQRYQRIESERDLLDKSSEELCHLLLKYQRRRLNEQKNRELSTNNETRENSAINDNSSLDDRRDESESQLRGSDLSSHQPIIIDDEDLNVSPNAVVVAPVNGLVDSSNTHLIKPVTSLLENYIRAETTPRFYCAHCDRRFSNKDDLTGHIQRRHLHELSKRFKCSTCNKSYSIERQLEQTKSVKYQHQKNGNLHRSISNRTNSKENIPKSYKCTELKCDKTFAHRNDLKEHELTHSSRNPFKCSFCSNSFKHRFARRLHAQKYHEKYARAQCAHCDKQLYSKQSIFVHLQKCHPSTLKKQIFECSFCSKSFSSKIHLKEHESICCSKTKKGKENRSAVVVLNKFEVSNLRCGICNRLFSCPNTLNDHKRVEHNKLEPRNESSRSPVDLNSSEFRLKCSYCTKCFARSDTKRKHERKFHRDLIFTCAHCDKSFCWVAHLKDHKKVHSSQERYKCSACDKSFAEGTARRKHERRAHDGVRNVTCGYCDQPFSLESVLSHIRSNHPERLTSGRPKSHKCNTCGKSYYRAYHLRDHEKVHSLERSYKCSQCDKCYKDHNSLRKHKRNVHAGCYAKLCAYCGRGYDTKDRLASHIRNVHFNAPLSCATQPNQHKSFGSSDDLKVYKLLQLQSLERIYKCSHCDKIYSSRDARRKHERMIHEGVRYLHYTCAHCDKSFHRKANLESHIWCIHSVKLSMERSKSHKCNTCGKSFYRASHLRDHQAVHRSERPYKCPQCNKCYKDSNTLRKHLRTVHRECSALICAYCVKGYDTKDQLASHIRNVHFNAPLSGTAQPIEQKSFRSSVDLKVYKQPESLEISYKCFLCDRTYSSINSRRKHERIFHNRARVYPCARCNESFADKNDLTLHIQSNHSEQRTKSHKCKTCGKSFNSKSHLTRHQAVHNSQNAYKCSHCDQCFKDASRLKKHEQIVHQGQYPYICAYCGKGYNRKDRITSHIREVHFNAPLASITQLNKQKSSSSSKRNESSRSSVDLKAHKQVQSSKERFKCSHCDKTYSTVKHKRHHERIVHEGVRYYTCAHCDKSLARKNHLTSHIINQHFPELKPKNKRYPFRCITCGKSYSYKSDFDAHLLTHSSLKPFKCSRCDSYFKSTYNRSLHERFIHDGYSRYTCVHCGHGANDKGKLLYHLRVIHGS
ncbi:zinc finger protein 658B-like [Planococcus citri]|uniref:zinc finger protein 658B-like n=1 Tax=Planococcus citri TaxID=170843 RepID=UPI0031F977C8